MYYVGKFDESKFAIPPGYEKDSKGYHRCTLVDRPVGSVHMGVGICRLQPKGYIEPLVHANEKGVYILEGEIEMKRGCEAFRLAADDYAFIPYGTSHAFRNPGEKAVRWFEMQAPQPKPPGGWQDTFFVRDTDWPDRVNPPDFEDPRTRFLGRFRGQKGMARDGAVVRGLTVYRFMEEDFGTQHFFMMRGELSVGGIRGSHDHTVEESYFVLSGEADMEIEGERYPLRPGDIAWTGVGTAHAFFQKGNLPLRWIETQAPQFPTQNGTRNYAVWERLKTNSKQPQ